MEPLTPERWEELLTSCKQSASQLDRLLAVMSLPSVELSIIPVAAQRKVMPSGGFLIFDDEMVQAETVSAELTVTQSQEIALSDVATRGDITAEGLREIFDSGRAAIRRYRKRVPRRGNYPCVRTAKRVPPRGGTGGLPGVAAIRPRGNAFIRDIRKKLRSLGKS